MEAGKSSPFPFLWERVARAHGTDADTVRKEIAAAVDACMDMPFARGAWEGDYDAMMAEAAVASAVRRMLADKVRTKDAHQSEKGRYENRNMREKARKEKIFSKNY